MSNRLDRVLDTNKSFTLHAEIDGDVIAKGSVMEITKVLTAMKCYGIRVDKFYVMGEVSDAYHELLVNADFISARFILDRDYEER